MAADHFSDTTALERAYDMGASGIATLENNIDQLAQASQYGLDNGMIWAVIAITFIVSTRALSGPVVAQKVREQRQKADREDDMYRKEHGLWPYHDGPGGEHHPREKRLRDHE